MTVLWAGGPLSIDSVSARFASAGDAVRLAYAGWADEIGEWIGAGRAVKRVAARTIDERLEKLAFGRRWINSCGVVDSEFVEVRERLQEPPTCVRTARAESGVV